MCHILKQVMRLGWIRCVIIIFCLTAFVSMLYICIMNASRTISVYHELRPQSIDLTIKVAHTDSALVYGSTTIGRLDSLTHVMKKAAANQCAEGLDDIRQETNNIINKVNGWLSFWLAMLALIGAMLPMISAWQHAKEHEVRFKVMQERLKTARQRCDDATSHNDQRIQQGLERIESRFSAMQDEYEKLKKEMEVYQQQMAITNIVNSFIAARENCLIQESLDRDVLRIQLLRNLSISFSEMIDLIVPDQLTTENKLLINTSLIQIHALYMTIRPGLLRAERSVQIEHVLQRIQTLIADISEDQLDVAAIESRMRDIHTEMLRTQGLFFGNEA